MKQTNETNKKRTIHAREFACCASFRRFEPWWPWELRLLKYFNIIIIIFIIIIIINKKN